MAAALKSGCVANIINQEEWDKLLRNTGLVVADLYQEWTGPCKPMGTFFNKMHTEIADDKIHFAQVQVDTVRSLNLYIGKCEPTFLLFGGGELVGVIRGSDAPTLKILILTKFEEELKVMQGEMERIVIKDTGIRRLVSIEDVSPEEIYDFYFSEMTFCILKPDLVAGNRIEEVIEELKQNGFEIIRTELRKLDESEVKSMYKKLSGEKNLIEILHYMTSGLSCLMALYSPESPITKLRSIIGPTEVEEAKETAPTSLRAKYGSSYYRNGIHASENREEVLRSLSLIFPDLIVKKGEGFADDQEKLILVIPKSLYKETLILRSFEEGGFTILEDTVCTLNKPDIKYLYSDVITKKDLIPEKLEEIYGSDFYISCVARKDGYKIANIMLRMYTYEEEEEHIDVPEVNTEEGEPADLIYSSFSRNAYERDYHFFFPTETTFGIIKPDAFEMKDEIIQMIKAAKLTVPLAKEYTFTTEDVEEVYSKLKEATFFPELVENMTSGPSLLLIINGMDVINKWRDMIGASNPEEASEQSQEKLRGIFGSTIIQNAVHAASNKADAWKCIKWFLGNVQIDELGNFCGNFDAIPYINVYKPASVDDTKVQDVLEKCGEQIGVEPTCETEDLELEKVASLYSTLKSVDAYPNVKCFIEVAFIVIPVLYNEEQTAFEKFEKVCTNPKAHRNLRIRKDFWILQIESGEYSVNLNFNIYKFKMTRQVSISRSIEKGPMLSQSSLKAEEESKESKVSRASKESGVEEN